MPQSKTPDNQFYKKPEPKPMVGWFDPRQLLRTAGEVIVSSIIGRHADRRLIEQLATQAYHFDFTLETPPKTTEEAKSRKKKNEKLEAAKRNEGVKPKPLVITKDKNTNPYWNELWIDYVADVGDGWNATYAVARQVTQPVLKVLDNDNSPLELPRGDILIFGGDEVYPTASRDEYSDRWSVPYKEAFAGGPTCEDERPFAFAIPGNHDWYDSLASFSEMFSGSFVKAFPEAADPASPKYEKTQGGWITPQNRSYFALKLPYKWWLFGVDLQLNHDVDEAQVKYFKEVLKNRMADDDRVIFCSPEPFWVYCEAFPKVHEDYKKSRLKTLVKMTDEWKFVGGAREPNVKLQRIKLYLAGDLHHYYRIQDLKGRGGDDGVLRITAGGGGAFMHPTHGKEGQTFQPDANYDVRAYPDQQTSCWLAGGNLFFAVKNVWFNLVTGTLYLLTAWLLLAGIGDTGRKDLVCKAEKNWEGICSIADVLCTTFNLDAFKMFWRDALFDNPFLVFLCLTVVAGFYAFTDPNANWKFRAFGGGLHGIFHLLLAGLITWLGDIVYVAVGGNFDTLSLPWMLGWVFATLWVAFAGAFLGSSLIGFYLWISLNRFGYHTGEGSSLRIQGYKNFLRMKLSNDGSLTIYPIGLKDVPRWRFESYGVLYPEPVKNVSRLLGRFTELLLRVTELLKRTKRPQSKEEYEPRWLVRARLWLEGRLVRVKLWLEWRLVRARLGLEGQNEWLNNPGCLFNEKKECLEHKTSDECKDPSNYVLHKELRERKEFLPTLIERPLKIEGPKK